MNFMGTAQAKQQQERLRRNEQKWTKPLMDAGWTVIPSVILDRQRAFGLDAVDVCILMHLAKHWWFEENLPHPSKKAIAECMNISESTVRRRIAAMEAAKLIGRVKRFDSRYGGQQTNAYDFTGLIREATPYAEEAVRDREARKKASEERRTRKRVLRVVGGDEWTAE
jgi:DNA-binding Lrp family transcriptional regulator